MTDFEAWIVAEVKQQGGWSPGRLREFARDAYVHGRDHWRAELVECASVQDELREENAELRAQNESLGRRNENQSDNIVFYRECAAELERERSGFRAEASRVNEDHRRINGDLREESTELQAQNESLGRRLENQESLVEHWQRRFDKEQERVDELRNQVSEMGATIFRLRSEATAWEKDKLEISEVLDLAIAEVKEATVEFRKLRETAERRRLLLGRAYRAMAKPEWEEGECWNEVALDVLEESQQEDD